MPPHQSSSSTLSYITCHSTKVLYWLHPALHATAPKFFIGYLPTLHATPPHQSSSLATFLHYMPPHQSSSLATILHYMSSPPTFFIDSSLHYMPPHQSSSSTLSYITCHPTKVLHWLLSYMTCHPPKFFIDSILHYMPLHQSSSMATILHYMSPTKVLHWLPSYITCHPTKVLHRLYPILHATPSKFFIGYLPTCMPPHQSSSLTTILHYMSSPPKFFIDSILHYMPPHQIVHRLPFYMTCHPTKFLPRRLFHLLQIIQPRVLHVLRTPCKIPREWRSGHVGFWQHWRAAYASSSGKSLIHSYTLPIRVEDPPIGTPLKQTTFKINQVIH